MVCKMFCDGSCDFKTQLGGAGVYIQLGDREIFLSKGFKTTTTSRMEGRAVHMGLEWVHDFISNHKLVMRHDFSYDITEIIVVSDSEYIVKAWTENRLERWQENKAKQIPNRDMWLSLLVAIQRLEGTPVTFKHVKGHGVNLCNDNVFGNNVADKLANYKKQGIYSLDFYDTTEKPRYEKNFTN